MSFSSSDEDGGPGSSGRSFGGEGVLYSAREPSNEGRRGVDTASAGRVPAVGEGGGENPRAARVFNRRASWLLATLLDGVRSDENSGLSADGGTTSRVSLRFGIQTHDILGTESWCGVPDDT